MIVNLNIDLEYHKNKFNKLIKNAKKISGMKKHNRFVKLMKKDHDLFCKMIDNFAVNKGLNWYFEYMHSGEPVGLHSDDDVTYWTDDVECVQTESVIIPLDWNCKQPYTICYDKINPFPRKMIFRKGEMRYTDNGEVFKYRKEWNYDEEVLKYNPRGTVFYKEYADLKVHEVYPWKLNTAFFLDTKRWHSSSWWLSENDVPDVSVEWKRCIIGFGAYDIPNRNL